MRVLVFGASGYIGRHIVRNLVDNGRSVAGVVRSEPAAAVVRDTGAEALFGDLSAPETLMNFLDGADAVIWAAQLMLEEERALVAAMLERLRDETKTFVFTSGSSVMSERTDGYWIEDTYAEDEPFVPRHQIAARLETEALVRGASNERLRTAVIRPPLVWGNGGCQIIADFYHSARVTGSVCHVGPGLNVYSNVHVEDLAELYRLVLTKGARGGLYFAVSGELPFGIVAETIARHLGVTTRRVSIEEACVIWDKFMGGIVFPSCSRQRSPRARVELGWTPREDRLDIRDDCSHPAYAASSQRSAPSWVRRPDETSPGA